MNFALSLAGLRRFWIVPVVALAVGGMLGCSSDLTGGDAGVEAVRMGVGPVQTQQVAAAEPGVTPSGIAEPGTTEPGVTETSISFGQSAAFSGPARELGQNMRLGIEAAFHEVNQRGGVHGRQLLLVSLDDAYEPEAAIANTQRFIEQETVFALIGAVGTPTSRSAVPVAAAAGVPYIAPFTGAAFLRDPKWDNVINLRASYDQETEEMVARMTEDLGIERIAVMYQDDSFGRAGYEGVRAALARRDMTLVGIGIYPRNTTAVKTALLDLQLVPAEAVILIGAYEPVGTLISWARHVRMDGFFFTLSFAGSNALAEQLGDDSWEVYVTQVVPFPTDDALPVASRYRRALAEFAPDAAPGFVSFEGYLAGRLAIFGLESCGRAVNRSCFLESFGRADAIDIDGFQLVYGDGDNQGSDAVFLTKIGDDRSYYPVSTLLDGR